MGEIFNEKIVARVPTFKIIAAKTGIILLAAAIIVFAVLTLFTLKSAFGAFFAFVVVGAGYGAWFLVRQLNVEYEYSVAVDDLYIDKIVARSRRKRVLSLDIHKIEEAGEANEEGLARVENMEFGSISDYSSHVQAPGRWYVVYSADGARHMFFFEPNPRMLQSFRQFAPAAMRQK